MIVEKEDRVVLTIGVKPTIIVFRMVVTRFDIMIHICILLINMYLNTIFNFIRFTYQLPMFKCTPIIIEKIQQSFKKDFKDLGPLKNALLHIALLEVRGLHISIVEDRDVNTLLKIKQIWVINTKTIFIIQIESPFQYCDKTNFSNLIYQY